MGGELSAESGKNSRTQISRTSSLKDITISDENANNIEVRSPESKPVKRSSTFSGLAGGRPRPQIIRRVKKKSKQAATALEHRDAFVSDDTCIDVTNSELNMGMFNNNTVKKRTDSTSTDESLFIPTKRIFEIESPPSSPTTSDFPVNKEDIPAFGPQSSEDRSTVVESNSNSMLSIKSSVDDVDSAPCRRRLSSSSMDEETPRRHNRSKSVSDTVENVQSEDECRVRSSNITRIKSSEKRKKIARSKSLGCPPELDALLEERDDEEGKSMRPIDKSHAKSLEGFIERRSSQTNLRREEHVKRSAHFSAMIKQLKENRVRTHHELSPYGQEVIANYTSPRHTPSPKTGRHLRQNEFFDMWVKDQSERINNLAEALKGDEFKMNELRSSFRGRELKVNVMEKLPPRSKSDKLPRRQYHNPTKYLSSDTEDELDNKFSSGAYNNTPKSKSDDGEMLKKQLSDTFSLLDSYFENSKKDLPEYERSRSTDSSARSSVSYRMSNNILLSDYEIREKSTDVAIEVPEQPFKLESHI